MRGHFRRDFIGNGDYLGEAVKLKLSILAGFSCARASIGCANVDVFKSPMFLRKEFGISLCNILQLPLRCINVSRSLCGFLCCSLLESNHHHGLSGHQPSPSGFVIGAGDH